MIPHDLHHFFVGQHVFVTGASGFIGGHVASLLIRAGAHVRALTRSTKEGYDSAIDWVEGDLLARDSIDAAMKDCRYVFHVAGDYRFWARNPREIFAQQCAALFVFCSSLHSRCGGRATWCQRLARRQMKRREVFPF
jgi:NAD(P)-dependent dehydrogenase (short-subunit alcohol dehydrogenase family)